jgi:hypothetical protein
MENQNINESILDIIQPTKNPAIWDIPNGTNPDDPMMKRDVRDFILKLLSDFKKNSDDSFDFTEIFMIGSNTTRQYKPNVSDIDIDVKLTAKTADLVKYYGYIPKGVYIPNTQMPVNVTILSVDEPEFNKDNAQNIYDIKNDKWIKLSSSNSKITTQQIPYTYISQVSNLFVKGFISELSDFSMQCDRLNRVFIMPISADFTEDERDKEIAKLVDEIRSSMDSIHFFHNMMFMEEKQVFDGGSHFKLLIQYAGDNKWTSANSLIYKYIDSTRIYGNSKGIFEICNDVLKDGQKMIDKAEEIIKKNTGTDTAETEQKINTQKSIETTPVDPSLKPTETITKEELDRELSVWYSIEDPINIQEADKLLDTDVFRNADADKEHHGYFSTQKRTEREVNHIVDNGSGYKSSKYGPAIAGGVLLGIPGLVGGIILGDQWAKEKEDNLNELVQRAESDSEASEIIDKIREELKAKNPDKLNLQYLKRKLKVAMKRIRNEMKHEQNVNPTKQIKVSESIYSDDELKTILKENGWADSDKNVALIRAEKFVLVKD